MKQSYITGLHMNLIIITIDWITGKNNVSVLISKITEITMSIENEWFGQNDMIHWLGENYIPWENIIVMYIHNVTFQEKHKYMKIRYIIWFISNKDWLKKQIWMRKNSKSLTLDRIYNMRFQGKKKWKED